MSYIQYERYRCRGCRKDYLVKVLNLGVQAIVKFKQSPDEFDDYCPLVLVECQNCHLVQLLHSVSQSRLYDQFHYLSGINQSMNDALFDIVKHVEKTVNLKPGDMVIDIGSNDGTMLSYFRRFVYTVGFEPAQNIVRPAVADKWINDYFSLSSWLNHKYVGDYERAKVILSAAMFYDLENPGEFLDDVKEILTEDGIFVVQMNDLDSMCQNISIDNICHEHLTYFSLDTLLPLLRNHGLYPIDVQYNNVNGGSIRVICNKTPNDKIFKSYKHAPANVKDYCSIEYMWNFFQKEKKRLLRYIDKLPDKGEKGLWAYGASTRGNTLLQLLGLDNKKIFAIADRNPKKHGKWTAGGNIPIASEEQMRTMKPDNILVLPYYFEEEFLKREIEYLKKGGKMIFPLPKFRIWTADSKGNLKVHGI